MNSFLKKAKKKHYTQEHKNRIIGYSAGPSALNIGWGHTSQTVDWNYAESPLALLHH